MSEHWVIYADWNPRCYQLSQAHKANINYKIGKYLVPETIKYEWKDSDYHD